MATLIESIVDPIYSNLPSIICALIATAVGIGVWWMWTKPVKGKITPIVDLNSQTRVLADGSRICNYLRSDDLVRTQYDDATTLYEAIRRGARESKNGPMLGARNKNLPGEPYEWISYNEVISRSVDVAHAFQKLGLPAGQKTFIGIYAKNRPEWIIVEHATYIFNNILVPLYETLGPDACVFIIKQTEIRLVVCDSLEKAKGLIKQRSKCPELKFVVVVEEAIPKEEVDQAKSDGIKLLTMDELESIGHDSPRIEHQPPKPEDLATISYTSGTTGTPKGVMLTHGNIIADSTTLAYFKNVDLDTTDVQISFLPLSHMFERVVQAVVYTEGGRVGFFSGNIRNLADDIKTLRPSLLPVVPRVLNRIYDKVMTAVNKSIVRKLLFSIAIKYKMYELRNGIIRNTSWVDKVLFKRIRAEMGGNIKFIITGSAPIGEDVLNVIRATMGCPVVEGYGQTEAVACVSVSLEGDSIPGHVGVPSPCNAVKLIDVEEMGYFAKDNAGEICVKGANVFQGYLKNEEETKKVLDEDGWLHTGDIGKWTEQGTLRIVDRKKNIFKLAQGEYIAPEKIENVYALSKFIAQLFVHGESLKTSLVAIVIPDKAVLSDEVSKKFGLTNLSMEEMCKCEDVKKLIMDDMIKKGKESGLHSFEQVKDIHLDAEQFSV